MNNLCVDLGWRSINKYGEQLCGDRVQIVEPCCRFGGHGLG